MRINVIPRALQCIPDSQQINQIIQQSSNPDCTCVSEALRAMKELCQRVTDQKMLIMQSLENDCDKTELNNQIAVSNKMFDVSGREMSRFFLKSSSQA
jgi:hypothetical protein